MAVEEKAQKIFIIGCGYIGRRVASLEHDAGSSVKALARSKYASSELEKIGIEVVNGDLDNAGSLEGLPIKDRTIYYFAPPPSTGIHDTRMESFLSSISNKGLPEKMILLSTTGVYGDCGGEWISEDRSPAPMADRAKRRLSAENLLTAWGKDKGVSCVILRVPGIYGPGRLPEKRLREGLPVLSEKESPFSNRIHADDLAAACFAAARRGKDGEVYNVSDGNPTTMTDYFFNVADVLGLSCPPEISLEDARKKMSGGMLSYLAESKKIDNKKMREELGITPRYPDLKSGLKACVEG